MNTIVNTAARTYLPANMDAQVALEEEMLMAGKDRFYRLIEDAKKRGEESGTGYGSRLIKTLIEPMSKAIVEFVAEANTGKAGRRHTALKYIELLEPEVMAYLTLKTVLDGVTKARTLTHVAISVSNAVQDECWMVKFKEANKEKFKLTMKQIEGSTSRRHSQRVARIMANRAGVTLDWSQTDSLHFGQKLIELLRAATGLVDIERRTVGPKDTQVYVIATPATLEWITKANEHMEILNPTYLPTIIPPKPWTSPFSGGYHSGLIRRMPLVKVSNRNYLEELKHLDLSQVYAAVNSMQDTAWKINVPVLEVLKEAWNRGLEIAKLPPQEDYALPAKDEERIKADEDYRKTWKKAAAKVHQANGKLGSKRLQLAKVIQLAEQFSSYEEFFFPYQLDFRGRVYAVPMFLTPQSDDKAKSVLTLARGKAIGDETGPGWLAIHGANTFGNDKVSLEERITWVEQNTATILSVAADPWGEALEFWTKADKPWSFLAFCFEWAGYQAQGAAFVSCLPIALDGSCNGLQHYSAALRDPVGGAAVNLIPSDKPKDIYGRVAEVALEMVKDFLRPDRATSGTIENLDKLTASWEKHDIDPIDMANRWLAFGLDRKVTKRSVMTLPYGSTSYSCREFLEEAVREKVSEGKANVFATAENDGIFKATMWLQPLVWQAIGQVVKAARVGMDWLKECAKLAANEGLPVTWETPDGFLIQQTYHDHSARRIKTVLDGQILKLTLREELPALDKKRQQSGIAPNWVHSMDATAMRMFVNVAVANGVTSFALIHDSYGTVAADVEMMSACLKKAFVQLYTERDPLAEFRVDVAGMLSDEALAQLPQLPEKGDLDLSLVEQSDFFFA